MILQIAILITGLLLIIFGANYLVDGSSSIARRFGLSEFVIGLTIVGIGTSTPEMVVSFISAFNGNSDMAIGNIVGSNILNVLLILGVTAMIAPITITRSNIRKDIPLNIVVTLLLIVLGMNASLFSVGENMLSRLDGLILLCIFVWYMWRSFRSGGKEETQETEQAPAKTYTPLAAALLIIGGLTALISGGRLFVNAATEIAKGFGVSDKFIAVTVLAAGTSMPELATSIVAAVKGRGQLALGNILGSNISNILLILGGSALICPLSFKGITTVDLGVLTASALFILTCAYTFKEKQLDRIEGSILVLIQAGYMWYLIANL
ncbi:MAG: calcium/sodium antiporter [Bacteroidales bacterium]|nr:calcium/sodium antiporter [Bacteroidales bacterium]